MSFKSGFVSIIGIPNVGKSTFLNTVTNEKIAITSNKPQTTRNTIKSIVTTNEYQIIFIDTPGIHKPKNKLGEYMTSKAEETITDVDCIIFMVDATSKKPRMGELHIMEQLEKVKIPIILGLNKIDLVSDKRELLTVIENFTKFMEFVEIVPISAQNAEGVDSIIESIKNMLPEGPLYYPDDEFTDQPEKQIMAEIIREKMLKMLNDEIPYGTGVEIMVFKERTNKKIIDIKANIYCEKETHKKIIIGKKGSMLKEIGKLARYEMENILGTKVFLELWIKVKEDWRNDNRMLKTLGYK